MMGWFRERKAKRAERHTISQPPNRPKMKFGRSLMSRYILLILAAVLFVPVIVPLTFIGYVVFTNNAISSEAAPYGDATEMTNMWLRESKKLNGASDQAIDTQMREIQKKYPRSAMYHVNAEGRTLLVLAGEEAKVKYNSAPSDTTIQWTVKSGEIKETRIPAVWTANYAIQFMKKALYRDPLTVVSYIGGGNEDKGQGFMVLEVNRKMLERTQNNGLREFIYLAIVMVVVFVIFILLSVLFFAKIRKRLVHLQMAMVAPGTEGIPNPVHIRRSDEIGHLEESFNQMVYRLTDSLQREREEEQLRKRLVAGLSHDLRTPLTVIRGHMHALHKETLSEQGIHALNRMESKMQDLSELIDNMLSYNLLTSGRYTLKLEQKDVLRMVREAAASWYPVWEKEQFEIDIDLPEAPLMWDVDEQGMRRVLDNLFQNVVRHAASGRYIRISTEQLQGKTAVVIEDHGPGIQPDSGTKGTGLGLSIVDLLIREMDLRKRVDSSDAGVRTYLYSSKEG
ncbi:HAMP domain-containing histidine kinase [Paenibacillus barcinonensis]|uniref:histidine kinase n=1 Tax=Paenibacillus barcinonensis TaxID=198119 RepID=A0A2V4VZ43_PAEBA|nr:HAMP domain-containing sensor histidine kinase [Paenibacillus barcinonensis]PYE47378.1 signal transduction histidine kinase [Paenibacillus barcinonensis]QKS58265.1 HAMP domain-containing histidine kinase [Paenibacillus barcinonensis]